MYIRNKYPELSIVTSTSKLFNVHMLKFNTMSLALRTEDTGWH